MSNFDYFISFRGQDSAGGSIASQIYEIISHVYGKGEECYFFPKNGAILSENFVNKQDDAINKSKYFILVLTKDISKGLEKTNDVVRGEIIYALTKEKLDPSFKIIPVAELGFNWNEENFSPIEEVVGVESVDNLKKRIYATYYSRDKFNQTARELLHALNFDLTFFELSINRNAQLFEYLTKVIDNKKKYTGSYLLGQINKEIFPSMKEIEGSISIAKENIKSTTFYETLKNNQSNHYFIIGEGGIGKTVLMLETCSELLKNNVPAMFVSLHEVCRLIDEESLNDVAGNSKRIFFPNQEVFGKVFFESKYSVLFFDGFNEIAESKKKIVLSFIKKIVDLQNIQIVITSRFNPNFFYSALNGFTEVNLLPLSNVQVENYLQNCNICLPNQRSTLDILKYPLMLTLYSNAQAYNKQNNKNHLLKWINEPSNFASIIWNYMQIQLSKYSFDNDNCDNHKNYVFVMEYVLPSIGYKMVKNELFEINFGQMKSFLTETVNYYKDIWSNNLPERIDDIDYEYSNEEIDYDVKIIFNILVKILHIFIETEDKQYSFFHQHFRDCLAGIHIINLLLQSVDLPNELQKYLDIDILKLIAELVDLNCLNCAIDKLRGVDLTEDDYSFTNLYSIYKIKTGGDISKFNFKGLDLRYTQLINDFNSTVKKGNSVKNLCFDGAFVDYNTFCQQGHTDSISALAFSPDCKYFASGSFDSQIIIWNTFNATFYKTLLGHKNTISSIEFEKNSLDLYTASLDGTFRKWNIATNESKVLFDAKDKKILDFCQSNEYIYLIAELDFIYKISKSNGEIFSLNLNGVFPSCISISYDYNELIVGTNDGQIIFVDTQNFNIKEKIKLEEYALTSALYPKDSKSFVGYSVGNNVKIYLLNTQKSMFIGNTPTNVTKLYFTNKELFSLTTDKFFLSWDFSKTFEQPNQNYLRKFDGHDRQVYCISISKDNKFAVTGSDDNDICLWDFDTGTIFKRIAGLTNWINGIGVSKASKYVISASGDKSVRFWDKSSFEHVKTYFVHSGWVYCATVSLDGKIAVTGDTKGEIVVWNNENYQLERRFLEHKGEIKKLSLSFDGIICSSCDSNGLVKVWRTDNLETIFSYQFFDTLNVPIKIYDTKISGRGDLVFFASELGAVYELDLKDGNDAKLKKVIEHGCYIHEIIYNEDYNVIITCGNNSLKIWNGNNFNLLADFTYLEENFRSIDFSTIHKTLVCATKNGEILSFDLSDVLQDGQAEKTVYLQPQKVKKVHKGEIRAVRFIAERIVSGGSDGKIVADNFINNNVIHVKPVQKMEVEQSSFIKTRYTNIELEKMIEQNGGIIG